MKKSAIHSVSSSVAYFIATLLCVSVWFLPSPSALGQAASNWKPRDVGADELKASRGPVEDAVRKQLLEAFGEPEIREILNKPWDVDGINYLGNVLMGIDVHDYDVPPRIANVFAYVATVYRDQPAGKKAAEWLDKILALAVEECNTRSYSLAQIYWRQVISAIAAYGSVDLLTPTFWNGFEKGLSCRDAILGVGNAKTLEKLKTYAGRKWDANLDPSLGSTRRYRFHSMNQSVGWLTGELNGLLLNSDKNGQNQGLAAPLRKKPAPAPESPK